MDTPRQILVVDDHPLFRKALAMIIKQVDENCEVSEAANSNEALQAVIARTDWHLFVLDLAMQGGRDGLNLVKDIKRDYPNVPLLVVSALPVREFAVRCIRAGAAGYLNKDTNTADMEQALRTVLNGKKYITPEVADELALHLEIGAENKPPHRQLSDREIEIFRHIAGGETVSEVAEVLDLSVKTVSTYRTRLLKKMGLKNNAQLMQYAVRHELF